jgi:hypothetical protein
MIGTAYYVFDPNRTPFEILATLHHVWFIPVCLYFIWKQDKLKFWEPMFLSSLLLVCVICIGRVLPLEHDGEYLNINVGHELWRKGKFPGIQYDNSLTTTGWVTEFSNRGWFPYYFTVRLCFGFVLDMISYGLVCLLYWITSSLPGSKETLRKRKDV